MLRSITPAQFHQLLDYSEIEPFGEERMDIRFAILAASLVGASGGTAVGGRPYTPGDFLRALRFDDRQEEARTSKPAQSVEYMEGLLNVWIDGSNDNLRRGGRQT